MKKISSYEEFIEALKGEAVPNYNEEGLISLFKNNTPKYQKQKRFKLRIVIAAIVILSTFLSSIALGSSTFKHLVKAFEVIYSGSLKNEKGEDIFKYAKVEVNSDFEEEDNRSNSIYTKYWSVMDKYKSSLEDNKMGVFVAIEAYEANGSYRCLKKIQYCTKIDDLISSTSTEFLVPKQLPEGYSFKNGTVEYQEDNSNTRQIAEDIYQKAKLEGKEYAFQKIHTSRTASLVKMHFVNKMHDTIQIRIDRSGEYNYSYDKNLPEIQPEIIKLGDLEVLYIALKGNTLKEMIFVDDSRAEKLTYSILFRTQTSTFDNMKPYIISMIEKLQ